jgi:hypothetical protein
MAKRRWWEAEERFKDVERRLRLNYEHAAKAAEARADARIEEATKVAANRERSIRQQCAEEIERTNTAAQRLANEILRIRLEFSRKNFGNRFTLYVTFEEQFMLQARDLKDMSAYIIDMLCAKLKREFYQIDFTRMKPVVPSWGQRGDESQVFRIDTKDEPHV